MMKNAMKFVLTGSLAFAFMACGQSEEEKKQEAESQQSISSEMKDTGDSLIKAMQEKTDTGAAILDSAAKAAGVK